MNRVFEVDMFENIKNILEHNLEEAKSELQKDKELSKTVDLSEKIKKAIFKADELNINNLIKMIDFINQKIGE